MLLDQIQLDHFNAGWSTFAGSDLTKAVWLNLIFSPNITPLKSSLQQTVAEDVVEDDSGELLPPTPAIPCLKNIVCVCHAFTRACDVHITCDRAHVEAIGHLVRKLVLSYHMGPRIEFRLSG